MSSVMSVFPKLMKFSSKYPVTRGMASYAVIWPIGSLIQQSFLKENDKELDYKKAAKFALYGSCFVAPTLHVWITIAGTMFPLANLSSAIAKALIEQVSYTPFAMACFYFGMTLLEGGTKEDGVREVQNKFLPTYKVGLVVWPFLQTLNYTVISEKNRVVFVSLCSLMWTTFLAYMKHLEGAKQTEIQTPLMADTTLNSTFTKRQTNETVWPIKNSLDH